MSEERYHHPYSPSTLQALEACPAYRSRQSDKPHERTVIGTISHKAVETRTDDPRLSDEDAERVASATDFWDTRVQMLRDARQKVVDTNFGIVSEIEILQETYLPIDDVTWIDKFTGETITGTTAGYIDAGVIDHTGLYAELLDLKFGLWHVESADNNLQGMAYALGMFKRYPKLEVIRFWFFQPGLNFISDAVFTRDSIPAIYLRIQVVVARARAARESGSFESANPCVGVCNFCGNLGKCDKVLEIALRTAKKFSPLDIPEHITPTMVLDKAQTGLALRLATVLKTWSEAFRTQTTDRVLRRQAELPEGYELKSSTERKVVDETKFKLCAEKFLTPSEYESLREVPGFGAIEDAIKEKAPRGHKKAAIDSFKSDLEQSGAVEKSLPFSYLKAISVKQYKQQTN